MLINSLVTYLIVYTFSIFLIVYSLDIPLYILEDKNIVKNHYYSKNNLINFIIDSIVIFIILDVFNRLTKNLNYSNANKIVLFSIYSFVISLILSLIIFRNINLKFCVYLVFLLIVIFILYNIMHKKIFY